MPFLNGITSHSAIRARLVWRQLMAEEVKMSDFDLFEVTSANFDEEVLKSQVPVIVDFWAEWCAPCRMMPPLLRDIVAEHDEDIRVGKLNVDDHSEIAARFGVVSIPTVVLFQNGEPVKQVVGALSKEMLVRELGLKSEQQ